MPSHTQVLLIHTEDPVEDQLTMTSRVLLCGSIEELPPPSVIANSDGPRYANLAVVVLAMCKLPAWHFGFLLVTDFTKYRQGLYNREKLTSKLDQTFMFGGRPVDKDLIFSVTIPLAKMDQYWENLRSFTPAVDKYNYTSPDRWNLLNEGIVVLVNMRLKTFDDTLEGYIAHLRECSRSRMRNQQFRFLLKNHDFDRFMARLTPWVDHALFHTLKPNFPIDVFMKEPPPTTSRTIISSPGGKRPGDTSAMITQAPKARKVVAAQAAFQQQFTQTQQAEVPPEGSVPREESVLVSGVDSTGEYSDHRLVTSTQMATQLPNDQEKWLTYLVNEVAFPTIAGIAVNTVPEGTTFETVVRVVSIYPEIERLLIKPFKRTLKVAEFRLLLGDENMAVEFHQEKEITDFFNVEEIEELLDKTEEVTRMLADLLTKEVTIRVQRRTLGLDFGFQKAYWGCGSNLKDMISPGTH